MTERRPIPDTNIDAAFVPAAPGTSYTPVFYDTATDGLGRMGSTNAGNSEEPYVGGGGINGNAFEPALLKAGQRTERYEQRHADLMQRVADGGNNTETYESDNPTAFSLLLPASLSDEPSWNDGTVFIDVFAADLVPASNPNNAAMVYVAPPFGPSYRGPDDEPDPEAFCSAIKQTAAHIVRAIAAYNELARQRSELPELTVLRLCLYSSNIYNQSPLVPPDRIALEIYHGLHGALLETDSGLVCIELPVGGHEFDAVARLLSAADPE